MGIVGRGRIAYINGRKIEPTETNVAWDTWFLRDNQVKTWIVNSVSPEIQPLILRKSTARDMWVILELMYGQNKKIVRVYQLTNDVYSVRQDEHSVADFYAALKSQWEELDYYSDDTWDCPQDQLEDSCSYCSLPIARQFQPRVRPVDTVHRITLIIARRRWSSDVSSSDALDAVGVPSTLCFYPACCREVPANTSAARNRHRLTLPERHPSTDRHPESSVLNGRLFFHRHLSNSPSVAREIDALQLCPNLYSPDQILPTCLPSLLPASPDLSPAGDRSAAGAPLLPATSDLPVVGALCCCWPLLPIPLLLPP
ncbi:hypothetical protein EJ110_NYTH43956 [Nymphaea thermarum]|nr:hypothetical protein EJ110_NYTH43956 [Nymphaea thermarum]